MVHEVLRVGSGRESHLAAAHQRRVHLVAAQGTVELRPGLVGARVPGAVGADGGAFYMVKGDAARVLRWARRAAPALPEESPRLYRDQIPPPRVQA